jgi:hypothetical protein
VAIGRIKTSLLPLAALPLSLAKASLPMDQHLHVIDANCSWIRSLVEALPSSWHVRQYRIYNPQWFPSGISDLFRVLRTHKISDSNDEVFCVIPGWNKFPFLSAQILQFRLRSSLAVAPERSTVLFTFPFYSGVAVWIRDHFPAVKIVYHVHDPFEFYAYPEGYVRTHESRLIPLCHQVFAISEKLRADLQSRYPSVKIYVLGNGVSDHFLKPFEGDLPATDLNKIRALGGPIVGVVGQINNTYDWELLESAAEVNPQMQLVFIGNLFEEGKITEWIKLFFQRNNVHWLGAKPHNQLRAYMDSFDILLNPLAINQQNDRRDPLRLYDYLSSKALIISTSISSALRHSRFIQIFSTTAEIVNVLGRTPLPLSDHELSQRSAYLSKNTWHNRGSQLAQHISSLENDSLLSSQP